MSEQFVIDNSVVMSWCFADEANEYADAILDLLKHASAVVPPIWPLEVVNVLLVAERRNRLQQADSSRFLRLVAHLPIDIEQNHQAVRMGELLAIGRANQLSSYNTSYLELAMRLGLPIATLDQNLRRAAEKVAVPLLKV